MAEEWTLVLVKPDGVKNRHVGEVITRIERKGYQIIDLKMIEPTENKLRQHYADKVNEPYFAGFNVLHDRGANRGHHRSGDQRGQGHSPDGRGHQSR